ncbi:hypothetical protein NWE55_13445 [Myroides albus]|uniref:hypothetical protein n=1 Tax=Myroides albus TaxID=2562892 RepID=UPI002158AAF0|nr:hypothetical protein [Myroides albus]UVD79117.1 hypothetical protein NWE55_13445 [Myroides albus]
MQTKTIITTLLWVCLTIISCQRKIASDNSKEEPAPIETNLDGSITIQGRVTVKGSDKPLLGVTTMNVKNKWTHSQELNSSYKGIKTIAYGENKRVFVDKKGFYRITIDKKDTLVLIPTHSLYKRPKYYTGFTKNQILNIELEQTPETYLAFKKKYKDSGIEQFEKYLKEVNPEKIITVTGTIYDKKTKKPLYQKDINILNQENTRGSVSFHFTDKYGQFFLRVPQNSHLLIDAFKNPTNLFPKNDTIVNIYL